MIGSACLSAFLRWSPQIQGPGSVPAALRPREGRHRLAVRVQIHKQPALLWRHTQTGLHRVCAAAWTDGLLNTPGRSVRLWDSCRTDPEKNTYWWVHDYLNYIHPSAEPGRLLWHYLTLHQCNKLLRTAGPLTSPRHWRFQIRSRVL